MGAAPLVFDRKGDVGCASALSVPESRLDLLCRSRPGRWRTPCSPTSAARRSWALTLPRCPAESGALHALEEAAARTGAGWLRRDGPPSRLVLADGGWDDYLASRDSHVRHEWRRKQRKLEHAGSVVFRTVSDPAELEAALADVLLVEQGSWKEGARTSLTAEAGSVEFYGQIARRCAERGWLRLHLLYLDGRPLAYLLGVRFRDELYALKTSYRGDDAALSPGLLTVLHAVHHALDEGCRRVDLLGSDARWKVEVATDTRPSANACVFSRLRLPCNACRGRSRLKRILARRAPALLAAALRLDGRLRARREAGGATGRPRPRPL